MPSYDPEEMKAQANLALEKVKQIIDLAKKDVERAEVMFSDGEDSVVLLRSMHSRLQSIHKKLLKYQKEFVGVKVKGEDYTLTTIAGDAVECDLEELMTKCELSRVELRKAQVLPEFNTYTYSKLWPAISPTTLDSRVR